MRRPVFALAFLLPALLAGCAPPVASSLAWTHPTATPQDMQRAIDACRVEADARKRLPVAGSLAGGFHPDAHLRRLFGECMERGGYAFFPPAAAPAHILRMS